VRKTWRLIGLVTGVCLMLFAGPGAKTQEMTALFPDLDGWKKDGAPQMYYPESLFEYINGAADVYVSYGFEELAALNYDSGEKRSLTVDVYRHSNLRNAFGIYSQEKPVDGNFRSIGTEAYYDKGVLNFFHGGYYVKLMGFYLEDDDESILTDLAGSIAERLGGEPAYPPVLACFPAKGKIAHSERYLARDVLGHSFLHGAFAADYEIGDETVRIYIIETDDESASAKMLEKYFEVAGTDGSKPVVNKGTYRFVDPRRSSSGPMNLRMSGKHIWGLFTDDAEVAEAYLAETETNLKKAGLID